MREHPLRKRTGAARKKVRKGFGNSRFGLSPAVSIALLGFSNNAMVGMSQRYIRRRQHCVYKRDKHYASSFLLCLHLPSRHCRNEGDEEKAMIQSGCRWQSSCDRKHHEARFPPFASHRLDPPEKVILRFSKTPALQFILFFVFVHFRV